MYIPKINLEPDAVGLMDFLAKNSFGLVVTVDENGLPFATHVPIIVKEIENTWLLETHISIANPQCKHLEFNETILIIFSGAHAFVSSSWYDHVNVNTWNYQAVHVYGKTKILNLDDKTNAVSDMTKHFEAGNSKAHQVENMDKKFLDSHLKGIVAFQIFPTSILANSKLSQNRDDKNYDNIVKNLEKSDSVLDNTMADIMKNKRK
jgi:transcriptional regulator